MAASSLILVLSALWTPLTPTLTRKTLCGHTTCNLNLQPALTLSPFCERNHHSRPSFCKCGPSFQTRAQAQVFGCTTPSSRPTFIDGSIDAAS